MDKIPEYVWEIRRFLISYTTEGRKYTCETAVLYKAYLQYCEGFELTPVCEINFHRYIRKLYKKADGSYLGIKLK